MGGDDAEHRACAVFRGLPCRPEPIIGQRQLLIFLQPCMATPSRSNPSILTDRLVLKTTASASAFFPISTPSPASNFLDYCRLLRCVQCQSSRQHPFLLHPSASALSDPCVGFLVPQTATELLDCLSLLQPPTHHQFCHHSHSSPHRIRRIAE